MNLLHLIKPILIFSCLFTAVNGFTQKQFHQSLEISSGLFNYHFDDTPILNLNYRGLKYPTNKKGRRYVGDTFKGLFYNSIGVRYVHRKSNNLEWSVGANALMEEYRGALLKYYYSEGERTHFRRERYLFEFLMLRRKELSDKWTLKYGGGASLRLGRNLIVLYYNVWGYTEDGIPFGDFIVGGAKYRDIGVLLHTEMSYQIIPRLNFNIYIQNRFFPLRTDFGAIKELKETYEIKNVPEILDLSFNLGLSYNFGRK